MAFEFGDLVLFRYGNWHHDPTPLVFILYSNNLYTEGLNSHYLTPAEAEQIRRLMAYVPPDRAQYVYLFLKQRFNTVLRAYRKYKTQLVFEIKKWKAVKLKSKTARREIDAHYGPNQQYRDMMRAERDKQYQASMDAATRALLTQLQNVLNRLQRRRRK